MTDQNLYRDLLKNSQVYEGCGNILGLVPLDSVGYSDDFTQDSNLRRFLKSWGQAINSDSVMVLTGDPTLADSQGYHYRMAVFEPNMSESDSLPGGISTMCGNGVRAVAAYIREQQPKIESAQIMTDSGILTVDFDGDLFEVNMGTLTTDVDNLKSYVNSNLVPNNNDQYLGSPIPETILAKISAFTSARTWSIGLAGKRDQAGNIEGEPHIVLGIPEDEADSLESLRQLAILLGPIITKDLQLFPQEINLNLVVSIRGSDRFEILNCTHERNLGDNPERSITQACGTGSTVVGGVAMLQNPDVETLLVHCLGGDLQISKRQDNLYMKGPAVKIDSNLDPSIISELIG